MAVAIGLGSESPPSTAQEDDRGTSAQEDDPGTVETDGDPTVLGSDEALAADAVDYAEQYGVSHAEAMERIESQLEFRAQTEEFGDAHPETFTEAVLDHSQDELRGTLRFAGQPPDEARELRDEMEFPVDVRDDAPATRASVRAQASTVHRDLSAEGYPEIVTAPNPADGAVEVTVVPPDEQRDMSEEERRERLPDSAREDDVDVIFSEEPITGTDDGYVYGGARTFLPNSNDGLCTTGFTVEWPDETGVLTAAHCNTRVETDNRDYVSPPSGSRYNMVFRERHKGSRGDMQWHVTEKTDVPQFYSDTDLIRPVDEVGIGGRGDFMLRFGRTTGRASDEVYRVGVEKETEGGYHLENLIAVTEHESDDGDSGGPWFVNNEAHGIHQGSASVNWRLRSVYSQARYVGDVFIVGIMTR